MLKKDQDRLWFKKWKKAQLKRVPLSLQDNSRLFTEIDYIKKTIQEKEEIFTNLLIKKNNKHYSISELSKLNQEIFYIKEQIKLLKNELFQIETKLRKK